MIDIYLTIEWGHIVDVLGYLLASGLLGRGINQPEGSTCTQIFYDIDELKCSLSTPMSTTLKPLAVNIIPTRILSISCMSSFAIFYCSSVIFVIH